MVHCLNESYKVWGALKSVLSSRVLVLNVKKCLYGVIVQTAFYGTEAWGMKSNERR